jgi:hypothetical protein
MTRQLIAKMHVNRTLAATGPGASQFRSEERPERRPDKWPVSRLNAAVRSLAVESDSRDKWPLIESGLRADKWPVTKSDLGHEKWSTLPRPALVVGSPRSDKWPVRADKWPLRADKWPLQANERSGTDKWPLQADKWPLS